MMWDSTMIQLSNISYISATNIASTPFPVVAALLILASLFLFKATAAGALLLIVIGGAWIFYWYQENEKRRQCAILTIRMNSEHNLLFTLKQK